MKGIKKVIFIIITVILAIILVINVYSFVGIKIFKQDLSSIGGYSVLEVISGSMEPTIHVGDMIIINTNDTDYKEDDIVTFKDEDNTFVTHRIISIDDDEIVTKGDYNKSEDEPIKTEDIVGKYVMKINGGGKIVTAFKSPFVMIMILIIGVLVCVFISTDKEGNPILEEDELEFKKYLENKEKEEKKDKLEVKKKVDTKKTATKRKTTKKTTKKKVAKKTK